jgi:hypothetical protein
MGISARAFRLRALLSENPAHGFFGSVAFKYQAYEPDPAAAARFADGCGFIPTTSGAGTGEAPALAKVETMAAALESRQKLALASGITAENVGQFLPHVGRYLVATGISSSFYEFDEKQVNLLQGIVAAATRRSLPNA